MVVAADPSVLRGVPEFFENEVAESLAARTESLATFRELGPPDLCHIIKTNPKTQVKDIGSYHYVLGTDASSSATLAAYLNSLTYSMGSVGGKPNTWKIRSGTYCCYNAFSRVDVRVEVRIPGGVDAYAIDVRGDRHSIDNAAMWQETHVSAVLRAILDDNDEADGNDGEPILGLRKFDALPTLAAEKRFLEAASGEFWKGWQLGTDPEVQNATFWSNHLTNGVSDYFKEAGRTGEGAKFFQPLYEKDAEVGAVLARSYLDTDEEIHAVEVLHKALKRHPTSHGLLLVQTDFLRKKKKLDMALKLAKLGVTYAPTEFAPWHKLTEVYIDMGDFQSALLSLNACPMFSYCEKDAHRMPAPARTHLPLKPDPSTLKANEDPKNAPVGNGTIYDENDPREDEIHPELKRLSYLSLRGTFSKAYSLLVRIASNVGWDELLRHRSEVFVMEEEYRIHRALQEEQDKTTDLERTEGGGQAADSPSVNHENGTKEKDHAQDEIESDGQMEAVDLENEAGPEGEPAKPTEAAEKPVVPEGDKKKRLSIDELMRKAGGDSHNESTKNDSPGVVPNPRGPRRSVSFGFKNKRLCEKWLDNQFLILYQDIRLYSLLKQEMAQFKNQTGNALIYRKTGAEWEVYGDLALRLEHPDDAKEAYKLCLSQKFSIKSWLRLLDMYAEEGNITETLKAVAKLVAVLDRAFVETTYPGPIARNLFKLIGKHGLAKVQNALISMNLPQQEYRLITRYFEYAELFSVVGSKW
ncbi:Chs5p-Arf1p-binding proteins-domain-containing protein [Fimicolochytrium jonesii]|uniref:Chs5p-Arf1p-binding proteins-domain-containing protein n=1 Tax=Fimicolochytrium jonesii TaxID=1396493 RepID=UPI0022FE0D57|nr:Chs5p-Arf1p-binding proteins-domain-containing protein [Fimicolochytrium jonesii]KAI8819368.1 Chs5p-Arf1p-binding proteins-domain-containing protein [Fimicolochytrium jonesii]